MKEEFSNQAMQNMVKDQIFLCEVVDQGNRTLAHLSFSSVAKQGLVYRLALGVLQLQDGRSVLYKRSCGVLPHQGRWDLFASPVPAGDAAEERILHLLELRQIEGNARFLCEFGYRYDQNLGAMVSLFFIQAPLSLHASFFQNSQHILLVDAEELQGLTKASPELFTRELLWYAAFVEQK